MLNVLIVYESKYGNTKLVAETIGEGMKEVEGIDVTIKNFEEINIHNLNNFDAILIGSPNHYFKQTRAIKNFINQLATTSLKGKSFAVFDTHLKSIRHRAVENMEKQIMKNIPNMKLITSGLKIRVNGIKGPITEGELPKCIEFGKLVVTKILE